MAISAGPRGLRGHPIHPLGRASSRSSASSMPGLLERGCRQAPGLHPAGARGGGARPPGAAARWRRWPRPPPRRATRCPARCGSASSRPSAPSCCPADARAAGAFPGCGSGCGRTRPSGWWRSSTAGRLDLLLLALPCACGDAETLAIAADPFLAALPAGHRLAGRDRVPVGALAAERLLLLEDGHCLRDHALDACGLPRGTLAGRGGASPRPRCTRWCRWSPAASA